LLVSPALVETRDAKGKTVRRWYYLDMKKAAVGEYDREDAWDGSPRTNTRESMRGQ
jgi:hypothetical protein